MVKPAVLLRRCVSKKTERRQDTFPSGVATDPAMIRRDAVCAQPKSGRSYTCEAWMTLLAFEITIIEGAIEYQTGVRVGLFPEITEGSPGKIVDKILIDCAERLGRARYRSGATWNAHHSDARQQCKQADTNPS